MKRLMIALLLAASLCTGSVALGGAIGGPAYAWRQILSGYQWIEYRVAFRGNEMGQVIVVGSGTPVDVYVYDEYGNLVAMDSTAGDGVCEVAIYVAYPRVYRIVVVNRSPLATFFDVLTN